MPDVAPMELGEPSLDAFYKHSAPMALGNPNSPTAIEDASGSREWPRAGSMTELSSYSMLIRRPLERFSFEREGLLLHRATIAWETQAVEH